MAFMEWNNSYSIQVPAMDEQHKVLVNLIAQLHTAMGAGKGGAIVGNVLDSLVAYTKTHFQDEERLLTQHGYPKYAQQKMEHEAFVKQVNDLAAQVRAGKTLVTLQVMDFLKNWLVKHIQGSDLQYGKFLVAKGVA